MMLRQIDELTLAIEMMLTDELAMRPVRAKITADWMATTLFNLGWHKDEPRYVEDHRLTDVKPTRTEVPLSDPNSEVQPPQIFLQKWDGSIDSW